MDSTTIDTDFLHDVISGLNDEPKTLPCKYFYDKRGSELFDQICELPEYYLTRAEANIMRRYAGEMAAQIDRGVRLVEYGSGSSTKTRLLLDHLIDPAAYVPVDISAEHLEETARDLRANYPHIEILPVAADFTQPFELPQPRQTPTHTAVYFPGSTIGNFEREAAAALLRQMAGHCDRGGGLLIGVDLKKDTATLEAAYNDAQGVTDAFNRNMLRRINRELDADFAIDEFQHVAEYNADAGRIEIFLESQGEQRVNVDGHEFDFDDGERIVTEHSHKYTIDEFSELAGSAGFVHHRHWSDSSDRFAVIHYVIEGE